MRSLRRTISLSLTVVLVLTSCQLCAVGDEASDRYTAAAQGYASADWQQAADQFRLFVAEHPADERVQLGRFFLGEALVQLRRHDEAKEPFQQFLASDAHVELKAKATFRLGEAYFLGGRLDQAATQLSEFMATWPDDPMAEYALMYLGETALDGGNAAEAERRFTEQLTRFPAGHLRYDVRLALARLLEAQQRGDDAIAEYRRVADEGEEDQAATALIDLASLYVRQQQHARALEVIQRFDTDLTGHRLAPRARLTGGWARLQLGDLDGARASFERLLADEELNVDARYGLAMVAAEEGKAAEIVDVFDGLEIDAAHPLAAEIAFQRADALRHIGDTEAALAGFERMLAESPDDRLAAQSHVVVLECLLVLGRYDELQRQAHEYLDVAGDRADGDTTDEVATTNVRRLLAQAMTQRGQHAEAADVLSQLVERDGPASASPDDLYRLAVLRFKEGDHDEVLRLVEQMTAEPAETAQATRVGRATIHQLHVAVLVELKRYADAAAIVDALSADEMAVLEKSQLALLYAEVGRLAEAAKLLDAGAHNADRDDAYWTAVEVVAGRALDTGDAVTAAQLFDLMSAGDAAANVAAAGLFGRARCEWRRGDGDTALAALARLAERYPQSEPAAEAALLRARILAETRGGDPALAALEHVVAAHPGAPSASNALLRLARMYENLSQDADAVGAYTRYIDEYPTAANRATAMLRNSAVLRRIGRAGEADGLLASLIDENPDSGVTTPARLLLARSAFDKNDLAQAGALVAAVLESDVVNDSTADAVHLQGLIAAAEGRWIDADVSMRRLVAEYPESEHRLSSEYWLAETAYRRGELARAETLLDELIRKTLGRRDHWVAMARLRRIQLLARERQWQDVIERGESLLGDFPEFQRRYEVDYLLGRALVGQAEFQLARQAFGRVVRSPHGAHTETAAMSQWMIGESYFHQRDYTSARKAYLLVDDQYEDFPQWQAAALLEAGKCSGQLEDWDDAARQFDQVVRHHPDSSHYDEAHQRLRLAEQKAPSPRQEIR